MPIILKGLTIGVNEDTLGSILKASVAQFIALEITKNNMTSPGPAAAMARDSRKVLPWLYRYFLRYFFNEYELTTFKVHSNFDIMNLNIVNFGI